MNPLHLAYKRQDGFNQSFPSCLWKTRWKGTCLNSFHLVYERQDEKGRVSTLSIFSMKDKMERDGSQGFPSCLWKTRWKGKGLQPSHLVNERQDKKGQENSFHLVYERQDEKGRMNPFHLVYEKQNEKGRVTPFHLVYERQDEKGRVRPFHLVYERQDEKGRVSILSILSMKDKMKREGSPAFPSCLWKTRRKGKGLSPFHLVYERQDEKGRVSAHSRNKWILSILSIKEKIGGEDDPPFHREYDRRDRKGYQPKSITIHASQYPCLSYVRFTNVPFGCKSMNRGLGYLGGVYLMVHNGDKSPEQGLNLSRS